MEENKLKVLEELHSSGILSDDEFERSKEKFRQSETFKNQDETSSREDETSKKSEDLPLNLSENAYLALMSFLIIVPKIGWFLPIILWIIAKNKSEKVDAQGKYICNWMITYFLVSIAFMIFGAPVLLINSFSSLSTFNIFSNFSGVLLLGAIFSLWIFVVPIIGAIKGLSGETWKYPLSLQILK
ncbi:MAG: DUF4870 domain-containing protein [Bacteroidales bacterium]|nr:DUF4870 domain-containing protein [Bacteroidales bacterium]